MKCAYLLGCVVLASVTSAQVSVDWLTTHDVAPSVDNFVGGVAVNAAGRVAVGGHTDRDNWPNTNDDFETCLYGSDGTLLWSRSVNVDNYERCMAVAFDGTGGIFVAGRGDPYDDEVETDNRTLMHYDALGNLLWRNTLSGTGRNSGSALALCPNGDVILAGARNSDLSLERFDPAGNILWSWSADGGNGGWDLLRAVAVGPGGDVWAAGTATTSTGTDIVVVRVSSAGVPVWIRTLDGTDHQYDYGDALAVDAAGNATVAGRIGKIWTSNFDFADAAIAHWDSAGNLAWVRTYGGTANSGDYASRIAIDPFRRIVVAGALFNSATSLDFAVWCLDMAGNLIWQHTWDGGFGGFDHLGDLVVDAMGAVWLCGASPGSTGSYPYDVTIASWDSTGAARWSWRLQAGVSQWAHVAAVRGNSVIVAGSLETTLFDAWVMKLDRTAVEFCFGDGLSTPCPCANASAPVQHAGCANSVGLGARLVDEGRSSLAADTLVLSGSQMPNGDALYFQGTSSMSGGAGEPFGDGLVCVGGPLIRLGSRTNVSGASRFPAVGGSSVSVRGLVTAPGTRTYQTWYRDASVFCTTANFNFSNGLLITWTL